MTTRVSDQGTLLGRLFNAVEKLTRKSRAALIGIWWGKWWEEKGKQRWQQQKEQEKHSLCICSNCGNYSKGLTSIHLEEKEGSCEIFLCPTCFDDYISSFQEVPPNCTGSEALLGCDLSVDDIPF